MPNKHKAKSKTGAKPKPGTKSAASKPVLTHKKGGADKAKASPAVTVPAKKAAVTGKSTKPATVLAKSKPGAPATAVAAKAPGGKPLAAPAKAEAAPGDKTGAHTKGVVAPAKAAPTGKPGEVRSPARPGGGPPSKKSRKSGSGLRRGSDGELFTPGEVLIPGGVQTTEEVFYLFRGVVAAERPSLENGVTEVLNRPPAAEAFPKDPEALRVELQRQMELVRGRFDSGRIEAALPNRVPGSRRTFAEVVERARGRRREIGAFLRGLDLGRTETSHMDSHGEASLQSLMEWAARLENLAEADERDGADYAQVHRGLDQLDGTTEALIIDVEQTLRRLRDRISRR